MKRICLTILVGLLCTSQLLIAQSDSIGSVPDTVSFQPGERVPDISTSVTSKEVDSVDGTVQLDVTFNVPDSVILSPNVTVNAQKPGYK